MAFVNHHKKGLAVGCLSSYIKLRNQKEKKMQEELEERLTELEIRFSHQALQVEELNDVVIECHKRIDHLVKENQRLAKMLETLAETLEESPDE